LITRNEFVAFVLGGVVQRVWPWLVERFVFWKLERDLHKASEQMLVCKHARVGVDFLGQDFPEKGDRGTPTPKCADCWALWIEPFDVTPTGAVQSKGYWTPNHAKPSKWFLLGEEGSRRLRREEDGRIVIDPEEEDE
jgi:hypothetical protein